MLRIYIHDQVPVTSFVLEGKLVGPWVKELEKSWESALASYPSRMMLVDLADVSFIDAEGRVLLARMRQKGVRLLSTGILINAIVDESLNLAYHGARAEKPNFNVTMQRSFDPAVGTADVYPQEITRVLLNLISNGFYATAKRKTEAGDGYEPTVTATTKDLGDKIEIRIRDNGTGIPDEVKVKIFNPFFTTKPAGEGTGLGLSMSHDIIVKQHGGKIDLETEPGQFTEFRIVLPRTNNFTDK